VDDEVEKNKTKPATKLSLTGLGRALDPLNKRQLASAPATKAQAVYGRGQMKGAGVGAAAAALAPYIIENAPPMEEAKTVEDLERGRIKTQVKKIMGSEASQGLKKGGRVGSSPRGVGAALRGFGKAMKSGK